MDSIMFSRLEDETRFADIFNSMIAGKEIKDFKNFSKESEKKKSARRKRYEEEEVEAVEHEEYLAGKERSKSKSKSKEQGQGDFDLVAMMQKRNAERRVQGEAFLADLEAKYCKPKKAKKGSK